MDISKLPIWSAYLIAPPLILLFAFQAIRRSDDPTILIAFSILCGLICAAALHGYVAIKRKLTRRPDQSPKNPE